MDQTQISFFRDLAAIGWPGGVIAAAWVLQKWLDRRPPDPAREILQTMAGIRAGLDRLHRDLDAIRSDQAAATKERASLDRRLTIIETIQQVAARK